MMATDTERLAFEKWFAAEHPSFKDTFVRDENGNYWSLVIRHNWATWQARAQDARCGELLTNLQNIVNGWNNKIKKMGDHTQERAIHTGAMKDCAEQIESLIEAIAAFESAP